MEGYAFSYYDVIEDGTLVEGAAYEDYYSGYAPMGETGLVELEIPDAFADMGIDMSLKTAQALENTFKEMFVSN